MRDLELILYGVNLKKKKQKLRGLAGNIMSKFSSIYFNGNFISQSNEIYTSFGILKMYNVFEDKELHEIETSNSEECYNVL